MKYLAGFVGGILTVILFMYVTFSGHFDLFSQAAPANYQPTEPAHNPFLPLKLTGAFTDDQSDAQWHHSPSLFRMVPVVELGDYAARSVCFFSASGRSATGQSRLSLGVRLYEEDQDRLQAGLAAEERTSEPNLVFISGNRKLSAIIPMAGGADAYDKARNNDPEMFDLVFTAEEQDIDTLVALAFSFQSHRPIEACSDNVKFSDLDTFDALIRKYWGDKADFDWDKLSKGAPQP